MMLMAFLMAATAFADTGHTSSDITVNNDVTINSGLHGQGSLSDASPQHRNAMISVFLGLPFGYWGYGFPFGVGGRYLLPILHDGFVPGINDSFNLEFGADLSLVSGAYFVPFISVPIEAMWQLFFVPKFSGYLKLGVALEMSFASYCFGSVCRSGFGLGAIPIGAIGVMFHFNDKIALRLEAGYPWFKVGLGFDL